MLALSLSLWLTVAAAAPADCVQSVDASTLLATVEAAESAYEDLDEDGFLEHMDKLALGLPCLVDVVDAPSAARIHRTLAVGLFATDRDRARAHVSAARAVAPDLGVKPLVSDQHPLARQLRALGLPKKPMCSISIKEAKMVFEGPEAVALGERFSR